MKSNSDLDDLEKGDAAKAQADNNASLLQHEKAAALISHRITAMRGNVGRLKGRPEDRPLCNTAIRSASRGGPPSAIANNAVTKAGLEQTQQELENLGIASSESLSRVRAVDIPAGTLNNRDEADSAEAIPADDNAQPWADNEGPQPQHEHAFNIMPPSSHLVSDPVSQEEDLSPSIDTSPNDRHLAVASLVHEPSMILTTAHEIDVQEQEERSKGQRRNTFRTVFLPTAGCAALFIVGVVLALVLTLGQKGSRPSTTSIATAKNTSFPTTVEESQPPTLAPTMLLMNLLDYTQNAMMIPSSPQFKARAWLDGYTDISNIQQWRRKQLYALATFFYSFHGDQQWPPLLRDDWLDDTRSECNWFSFSFVNQSTESCVNALGGPDSWDCNYDLFGYGANASTCNDAERFTALNLSQFTIANASIPPEIAMLSSLESISIHDMLKNTSMTDLLPSQLGLLPNLTLYDVTYNTLSGSIPTEIGLLKSLEFLDLYFNFIDGPIPSEIGLLSALKELRLDWNFYINGSIPSEIGLLRYLTRLYLDNNSISGTIPSEIGLMTNMVELFLNTDADFPSYNPLSGSIPTEIGLLTNLDIFFLLHGNLSNTFPSELGLLTSLMSLDLSSNSISGSLPTEIGLMTSLMSLYLSSNSISGSLPTEIGLMTSLMSLDLSSNLLSGSLPTEIGLITGLTSLHLSSNLISGSLPTEVFLLTALTDYYAFDLSSNSISGQLPAEFGLMTGLQSIDLSGNLFSGSLPTEIGLMIALDYPGLVLSFNSISGSIPTELGQLKNLSAMEMTDNSLSHTIPTELGLLNNMFDLQLANNSIVGTIPTELGKTQLSELDLSFNDITGNIPSELGLLFYADWMYYSASFLGNNLTGTLPLELCYVLLFKEFYVDCSMVDCSGCNPPNVTVAPSAPGVTAAPSS